MPEGGTATFSVSLDAEPAATVTVAVAVDSGDTDITIASGGSLTFTDLTWNTPQTVTVAAAEDNSDTADGSAQIEVDSTETDTVIVTATEADDDAYLTVTDGTPSGTTCQEMGVAITITATPPAHKHFGAWTGDTAGVADTEVSPTTITLAGDASVTATCAWDQHTLTVSSPRGDPQGPGDYDYGTTAHWV